MHGPVALGQRLDRLHRAAVGLRREQEAGANGDAVEEDRARAADAVLAAEVRSGQAGVLANEVGEQLSRLDERLDLFAVHLDADDSAFHHAAARSSAFAYARPASSAASSLRYAAPACTSEVASIPSTSSAAACRTSSAEPPAAACASAALSRTGRPASPSATMRGASPSAHAIPPRAKSPGRRASSWNP